MVQANGTTNGYLSSTDWTTFNNKSSFDGTWTSLSGKPNFSKWDKDSTDNVIITGNQTIAGNKTFTGTTTVAAPVNATDAATKAYVDSIKQEIKLEIYGEMGVTDVEGNTYKAVKIGNQVWMKENLKTTKSNDGTDIPNVTNSSTWIGLTTPGYVWYNNDISNKNIYGAIYNWHSVNTGKLCPVGWHVPTNTEWTTLVNYIGGNSIAGGKLKETGFTHWLSPNTGATNESGFTALPGSSRDNVGNWGGAIGINGLWWTADAISSNTGKRWYLSNTNSAIVNDWSYKVDGLSVRCIKDGSTGVTIPAVSSSTITNITSTTATVGGNVTSDGNGTITERGVYWSTSQNPETTGTKLQIGSGTGTFSTSLTGLTANTTYYIKAYAINSKGPAYGLQVNFITVGNSSFPSFVFTKTVSGFQQIFSANIDFTTINQLTSVDANYDHPRISPDGNKVAYAKGSGANYDIWVMNIDGSNKSKITNTNVNNLLPAWHSNGKEIIYEYNNGVNTKVVLRIVRTDGTNDRLLIDVGNKDRMPSMNPADSNLVVYYYDAGNWAFSSDLRIRNLTSNTDAILVSSDGWAKNTPKYSHDGQSVIWEDIGNGTGVRLKTVNASTKANNVIETITASTGHIFGIYSPDDQYIYFLRRSTSTTTEIVRRNADGSNPIVIYTGDSINWLDMK
jgi:uncharacterized protein (TIGR02145 family)